MMLAALLLAGQLAAHEPPRFTMTREAGDLVTAEVFALKTSDLDAQMAALLPVRVDDQGLGAVEVRSADGLSMAYRAGSLPGGPVIMYVTPQPHALPELACRLTRDPQAETNNADRAIRWCFTFMSQTIPVLVLPQLQAPTPEP